MRENCWPSVGRAYRTPTSKKSQHETQPAPNNYVEFSLLAVGRKTERHLANITGWFSRNHTPTLPKSHSDFTKIADWFSQNHWLIFTKTRVDFEAPDCCFTVRRFKTAPSPIVRPACQKVSAVSSRACRVALTVFVLVCEEKKPSVYWIVWLLLLLLVLLLLLLLLPLPLPLYNYDYYYDYD